MCAKKKNQIDHDLLPMEDPDDWEVVPDEETVAVSPRLGAMISVRLDAASAQLVREAARITGTTQSDFLRRAAEAAAKSIVEREPVRLVAESGTTPPLVWSSKIASHERKAQAKSTSSARDVKIRDVS